MISLVEKRRRGEEETRRLNELEQLLFSSSPLLYF